MAQLDDITEEFLIESSENLEQLDGLLIDLEENPENPELLASIFRTMHSIKGMTGFLGFSRLENIAHAAETLLSKMRDGEILASTSIITALLHTIDVVRAILRNIESTGEEGEESHEDLIETLRALSMADQAPPAQENTWEQVSGGLLLLQAPDSDFEFESSLPEVQGAPEEPELPPTEILSPEVLTQQERPLLSIVQPPKPTVARNPREDSPRGSLGESSVRVDVAVLDQLMNLVGELVLTRNQIIQYASDIRVSALLPAFQRLNLLTTELQDGVMQTRMQPIRSIWNKFPRVVRDLALACDKQVVLEMEGEQTELDRTVIEAIKDPLTHIIRNCVDHGIESPETRAALGKNPEGIVHLRAYHEAGQVIIEISDDGKGIHRKPVLEKAISQGLITRTYAESMSDREIYNLLFRPGFSTAAKVTHISGRGVGMDVVKTQIEKVGGTLDVQSLEGRGTTLRLKIPLTLAIIPALFVRCGEEKFAIPQLALQELVRIDSNNSDRALERLHDAEVYRLRDKLLTIVHLRDAMNFPEREVPPPEERDLFDDDHDVINVIVLQVEDHVFGLVVDEIYDTEEIVVKPLSTLLAGLPVYAGATIMGDGQVALILDVSGIAHIYSIADRALELSEEEDHRRGPQDASDLETLLLCGYGKDDARVAIPMECIDRLEEFSCAMIESVGSSHVVQYRDELLPVASLYSLLGEKEPEQTPDYAQVVVFSRNDERVGLIVEHIHDIVEASTQGRPGWRHGVRSLVIMDDRVTECLDMDYVFDCVMHTNTYDHMAAQ